MSAVRFNKIQALLGAAVLGASLSASAATLSCVTGANGCTTLGESLVSWSLTPSAGAQYLLTIANLAQPGNASFISGVSFDLGAGQSVQLAAAQNPGVSFVSGGGAHLPNTLGWTVDADFGARPSAKVYGVNAGESLVFTLSGYTPAGSALRFGVHLQGLPDGRSEKLVTAVPEPQTQVMLLAGLGVIGVVGARRRAANR